ncbi:MAG: SDR family oxidoreductase [Clostridiales bacterium]|nr:SDR family oxidoreductase [Clostridiales bacterium]
MGKSWMDDKTVIITGASSGMGRDIALRLIREHNCTVIGVARSEAKMKALVSELGDDAYRFSYRLFDVSVRENWEDFARYIEDNGICPDILVNNAGILPRFCRFDRYSMEEIEQAMQINFFASVYAIHRMLPILLRAESPAIINVDSAAALMSLAGTTVYSASKAALKGLTEALREELRGRCYVGLICPGFTKTDIFRNQKAQGGEKAFDRISTSCETMVDRIMNGMDGRRHRMVYGTDARFMDLFGRLMPVSGSRLFSNVLKRSKLPLFDEVFQE